jgi:hypothetical protein
MGRQSTANELRPGGQNRAEAGGGYGREPACSMDRGGILEAMGLVSSSATPQNPTPCHRESVDRSVDGSMH